MLTRRRFIAISAALVPTMALGKAPDLHTETGIALGARVTLRIQHPDAPRLAALAMDEIWRLEGIFSLYKPDSSLSRLNRDGTLRAPPFELLECLSIAGSVHHASGGRFDPTVQPLWSAQAMALERGTPLTGAERATILARIGWHRVNLDPGAITLQPGTALTLNGIAQGYIADRVAALLARNGLTRALIDTGEMAALPGGSWPVRLPSGDTLALQDLALATSSPLGMTFGGDGVTSHILNPSTGRPALPHWEAVTVSARSAALADAVSTAACLLGTEAEVRALCDRVPGTTLVSAIAL
ncbi:FAD:protein FMN transferase [Frigidibacter albus]|uniref:FAD:protein FMN transferase n=1 Tax=Frigidibacter albus TaxID=1465486 RepID=A0A6L8VDQ3_9RHOB|nr:FAD:protein FMN transferase [Frigidibacter albus]MZQ88427.1 FAD:protein FMN transferase [Frigidibacter albus]NBE29899.1 FAD:protein FMN transferase [Frigidibacter albus]GGH45441.1 FAD:protein FMN transferase [Frigidibacter albus]